MKEFDVSYINLAGCVTVFLLALLIVSAMIPQVLLISRRKRLFDLPDCRKVHSKPIPRLGGIVFLPGITLSTLPLLCLFGIAFPAHNPIFNSSFIVSLSSFFCGLVILFLTGLKDDLIGVSYSHKFFLQMLAGLFLVFSGNWINNFYGILGLYKVSPFIGIPFTLFLTMAIINAINLIDGVDGLAGTLVTLAAFVLGCAFLVGGDQLYAFLAFSVVGIMLPFLFYNFSSRKKIFRYKRLERTI